MTITILDGGMGRELQRSGAPFQQPEWSALALIEAPEHVSRVHRAYIDAGSEVITTNSYAVVPFHIGEQRFAERGLELVALSGRLAREAADAAGRPVKVAGSLPPVFGSYRPDLFEQARAGSLLGVLVEGLAPHVDLWLAETQSSLAEIRAARQATAHTAKPFWTSFTLKDDYPADLPADQRIPQLRSGETVAEAVTVARDLGVSAVLFNCSQPEVMEAAVKAARAALGDATFPIGVYANGFPPQGEEETANDGITPIRADLTPEKYGRFAAAWIAAGATMVGGCCGIGPEHICEMAGKLRV
ncbi:homocysteine S-methyltransferase family protein [Oryzibacter oryziterrae]|uniref:homocysteine S-methyltransferase family protein n=1 Tax=Oryzibacter oryziterrae TaxID=2766474 RepID=UPI001F376DD8|nr:homocysteine S-methyltransferase family protein [Oryzibacter oryziterrae]